MSKGMWYYFCFSRASYCGVNNGNIDRRRNLGISDKPFILVDILKKLLIFKMIIF